MTWHIIVILAFVVIYNIYRYYREQKDGEYCPVIETISSDGKGLGISMEFFIAKTSLRN